MKNWSRRKKVSVAFIISIVSMLLIGNIIQYSQNTELKERMREQQEYHWDEYSELSQKKEALEQNLEEMESDLEFEKILRRVAEEDYQKIATWTLEEAKRQAEEDGFDPDAVDWFLNSQGHWCFWFYDWTEWVTIPPVC